MTLMLAVIITAWHLYLLRSAWFKLRTKLPPRPIDFALASFVVYYDIGLLLDAIGIPYNAPGFDSLTEATFKARVFVYSALVLVPPLLVAAAHYGRATRTVWPELSRRKMSAHQERQYLIIFSAFALVAIALSVAALLKGGSIPSARLTISNWLGSGAILLYMPLNIAAYFPLTENARGRRGLVLSLLLASAASLGVLALGQRTLVLLPFVIVVVCTFRFSVVKLVAAMGLALLAAVGLGLLFKPTGVTGSDEASIFGTINESLARAPVMASAFQRSEPAGTSVMEYPGEGYVTSALILLPRQIAPFKGESTAQRFTDEIQGEDRFGGWAFGIGAIEEAAVNVGWALSIFVLAAIGWGLGALETAVVRHPALLLPSSGGALWLCGYDVFAILLLFGVMFATIVSIDVWFFGRSHKSKRGWRRHPEAETGHQS